MSIQSRQGKRGKASRITDSYYDGEVLERTSRVAEGEARAPPAPHDEERCAARRAEIFRPGEDQRRHGRCR